MIRSQSTNVGILSRLGMRSVSTKRRTIVFGLKSESCSREVLLRFLSSAAIPGDNVIAVHVLEPDDDSFNPNSFHIHEDLCKSKKVEFQLKVCTGGHSYITELAHQVRISFATILAIGCRSQWPKDASVATFLKALPPTCSLLVMDSAGTVVLQRQGTCQEGSASRVVLETCVSSRSACTKSEQSGTSRQFQKSLTMPCPPKPEISRLERTHQKQQPGSVSQKLFQRLAVLEIKGSGRRFTSEEISSATNEFSPEMVIGEGGNSRVYWAKLDDGQLAAVKVLSNRTSSAAEDLFREVETLSCVSHNNIVQLIGYCYGKCMHAVVYGLQKENLKQKLKSLGWSERMKVAIGVGKALEYLHSLSPPIIHRDVKSSNILLSDDFEPKLSDFGAAIMERRLSGQAKPFKVVGTFGYLAPEYMMYGKIDEKIDVYSYGVVLLELITGKEAIQTNQGSNHESLVLWARSLLSCGLSERLVDPCLNGDYDKDEMRTMIIAARLCLLHSSSRRPPMKNILQIFEQPEQWLDMQRKREELLTVQAR